MKKLTPYQILKQESERVSWPISYETDLTQHDKRTLRYRREIPNRFLWILRKHGTYLFIPDNTLYDHADWAQACCQWYKYEAKFYVFTGEKLIQVSPDNAFKMFSYMSRLDSTLCANCNLRELAAQNTHNYRIHTVAAGWFFKDNDLTIEGQHFILKVPENTHKNELLKWSPLDGELCGLPLGSEVLGWVPGDIKNCTCLYEPPSRYNKHNKARRERFQEA